MNLFFKFILLPFLIIAQPGCNQDSDTPVMLENNKEGSSPPAVSLIRPTGGETVVDTFTITWSSSDPDEGQTPNLKIDLEYSGNGSAVWRSIDSGIENRGYYLWDTSSLPDNNDYRVRVTAEDPAGLSSSDSSIIAFTIAEAVIITDRTGVQWNITHAVLKYGMEESDFNYGLGPNAIQPVILPDYISPGEPEYPADDSEERVIGIDINGDARAYPIVPLSSHEVVNDYVGESYVAVTY